MLLWNAVGWCQVCAGRARAGGGGGCIAAEVRSPLPLTPFMQEWLGRF